MTDRPSRVFRTGPSALHPSVPAEIHRALAEGFASLSHRSAAFRGEVDRCTEALRVLLDVPPDHRILFVGSASEAMERIVGGVRPARSLHLVNGAFARRFHRIAEGFGVETTTVEVPDGEGFRMGTLDAALQAACDGPDGLPELVAATQNETSTGVRIPPDQLRGVSRLVRESGALLAVDLVSGWPVEAVEAGRIDAGVFSVQKAFGLPAGLGVIVVSPELVERSRRALGRWQGRRGYFQLSALADAADRNETVATPNMLAIRLLGRVAERYVEEGIQTIRAETTRRAGAFWRAVERCPGLRPFVPGSPERSDRSRTILVVAREDGGPTDRIREALGSSGFLVSDGYGPWRGQHLRIANFPAHEREDVEALIERLVELASDAPPGGDA